MTLDSCAVRPLLDRLLATLDVGVVNFTVCDIRDGVSVRFDACKTVSVHYCMSGSGALVVENQDRIELSSHSFVMLPPGLSYSLESACPPATAVDRARLDQWPSRETVPTVLVGDAHNGITTACGELTFDNGSTADPFAMMRRPIVTSFDGPLGLRDQFVLLLAECARPGPGSRVLIEALLKQCLVMALRRHIGTGGAGLLGIEGVADPRLARALNVIFESPQSALSVQRLADVAGMSRSAFAARFQAALGKSPMAMLKLIRLRKARELLATTPLPVSEVARAVGFASRSNFSQAFNKLYGMDPTALRRLSKAEGRAS